MECIHDRVFFYWRHGLFGHVISICSHELVKNPDDIFLQVWIGLANGVLKNTEKSLETLEILKQREDLSLLYKACLLSVKNVSNEPSKEELDQIYKDMKDLIAESNSFSIFNTCKVLMMFRLFDLSLYIIRKKPDITNLPIKGWIYLLTDKKSEATKVFDEYFSDYLNQDPLALYGRAIDYRNNKDYESCTQTFSKLQSSFNFPECAVDQAITYVLMNEPKLALELCMSVKTTSFSTVPYEMVIMYISVVYNMNIQTTIDSLESIYTKVKEIETCNNYILDLVSFAFCTLTYYDPQILNFTSLIAEISIKSPNVTAFSYYNAAFQNIHTGNIAISNTYLTKAVNLNQTHPLSQECFLRLTHARQNLSELNDQLDFMKSIEQVEFIYYVFSAILARGTPTSNDMNMMLLAVLQNHIAEKKIFHPEESLIIGFNLLLPEERLLEKASAFRYDLITQSLDEIIFFGRYQDGSEMIDDLLSFSPGYSPFVFFKVIQLQLEERHEEVINCVRQILVSHWEFRQKWCLAMAGFSLISIGNTEFARECLTEATTQDKEIMNDPKFLLVWAKTELSVGNGADAIKKIEDLFKNNPQPLQNMISLIDTCIADGQIEKATQYLKSVLPDITRQHEKAQLAIIQAKILAATKQYEKAFEILAVLSKHSKYADQALVTEAEIKLKMMNNEELYLQTFENAIKMDKTPERMELLGDAYCNCLMFEEGYAAYKYALDTGSNKKKVLIKYVFALVHAHRYEKAVSAFTDNASSVCSDSLFLIKLLIKLKRFNEALKCLKSSMKHINSSQLLLLADFNSYLGLCEMQLKNYGYAKEGYAMALRAYSVALPLSVDNCFVREMYSLTSNIAVQLGRVNLVLNDKQAAEQAFEQAYGYDESNGDAVAELFHLAKEKNDIETCMTLCNNYLMNYTNETVALLLTSAESRDYNNSIKCLQRVLEKHPNSPRILVRYIEMCYREGRLSLAESMISKYTNSKMAGIIFAVGLFYYYSIENEKALNCYNSIIKDRVWGQAAKLAKLSLILNPKRKYIWDSSSPLTSVENINEAKSIIPTLDVSDDQRRILNAEVYEAENSEVMIEKAIELLLSVKEPTLLPIAMMHLARCYIRVGRNNLAMIQLNSLLKGPVFHENYSCFEEGYLMRAYISLKDNTSEAQHDTILAINLNKSCLKGWSMSAEINTRTKSYRGAATNYRRCWELTKEEDPSIGYNLAYYLMKSERYSESLHVCRQILDKHPGYKDVTEAIVTPAFQHLRE